MRTLFAAAGFAARARGHEDADRGDKVETEVSRATLNDPEVSRGWSCGQAVSEMVELGPSLVERLLCAGSTRICAAFEHVLLIQTNYRDQASQN